MTKTLDHVRTYFTTRRDLRRRTAELSRELAAYDSPSDRLDLEATIARHPESETREVEAILRLHTTYRFSR
ncbi:hypothetical protein ABZ816_27660 [Actinosynnema sp. NPDC047251]|uniref:Uncharacterized protein n=1 Tax=Saccharothrix espanaensis (strain ATCC 51144 / DSM 44229 / JCM 9112 / NBRC 15066 / NRRL 15764) TaxID=1179773 RepID=K0JTB6_SACES|nr:hypothetical protein [Saccharothrix espanaensis]CCH28782.1 hypothetical protein BN6_14590 [Saccharothrix espanaensis DSM 44229]